MMSNLSPAPGVPQTPTKAYVAAGIAFLVGAVGYYLGDEDPFTKREMLEALFAGAVGAGVTGGPTFAVRNRRK
jgi:hypothetical protein